MPTLEPEVIDGTLDTTNQQLAELLKESEERFHLLADATPVMIWMAGSDQLCDYFNSVWLEFTGCPLEQQLGNGWTQGIHPEDKQRHRNVYSTAFKAREKFQIEYRLRRADGEYRWVLDTGVPRFTPKGSFVGYIGSCVDITERKQAEEKLCQKTAEQQAILQKQQQQQQVILDSVPAMIWFKDTENRILHANQAAAKAMGLRVEEIEGRLNHEMCPEEAAKYHQDDLEVINSGSPKLGIIEPLQTASGEKRWIQTDKIPWRDDDGKIAGVIVFAIDLTERQKSQLLLQESLTRFDLVATASQEGLWDAWVVADDSDNPNNPVYYSPRFKELLGYEDYEFENTLGSWTSRIHPEDRDRVLAALAAHLKQKTPYRRIEYRILTKSGEYRWFSASGQAIWDVAGNPIRVAGSLRDITVRKQAEAERDALRAASQRFFNVSVDMLCTAGFDGYFKQVNPAVTAVLGYTPEEFMAVPYIELVHPEDRARTNLEVQKLALGAHSLLFENRYRCKDGSYKWLAWNAVSFLEEGLIYCSARNISDRKALEKELALRQAHFNAFFASAPAGLMILDDQLRFAHINETLAYMNQRDVADHLGKTFTEVVPAIAPILVPMFRQILSTGEPILNHELSAEGTKQPGVKLHCMASYFPLIGEEGKPIGIGAVIIEITERKRAEAALRESEARLGAIFNQAAVGIKLTELNGSCLLVNQKLCELVGYTQEEMQTRTFQEITHPEELDADLEYTRQLLAGEIQTFSMDKRYLHKEGSPVWVNLTVSLVRSPEGEPKYMISIVEDIRDRKRTEEALKESEAQLRLALNAAQMGVWDWNIETGSVTFSEREEAILGFTRGKFDGRYKTYFNRIHPEDRSLVTQVNQNTIEEKADYDIDYRIIRPDDTIHWLREKGAVLRDETGKAVRMIGITMDITDRQQAQESLRQSEERYRKLAQQEELLYRIASQIRNSLNLDTILETAVAEIRNLLQIDRCFFIWYRGHAESAVWEVVHEAKPTDLPSFLGSYAAEALEPLVQPLLNLEVLRVDDVQNLQDEATRQFFQSLGYKSLLNLPIQTLSGAVGVVACVNGNSLRPWNDEEVELLCVVCDQLAIAINQAELYAQSRAAASVATEKATQLELALHSLQQTQFQLIQTEKMSSLGQLVAGVAHEINNPVTFISGNVDHASDYIKNLLNLLELYRAVYPQPTPEIQVLAQTIDLDFVLQDLPKVISSMKVGADRIRDLVLSLRNFSRLDEAEKKLVDIHEGLDNTLLILQHRLRQKSGYPAIQVIKEYGQLPLVNCYPGQLNQVFMNLLTNAIDALESFTVSTILNPTPLTAPPLIKGKTGEEFKIPNPEIWIRTEVNNCGDITIRIADNGLGMTQEVLSRLFDPFFTTKPIGKGTGLGLSISYQIVVEKHKGTLHCNSEPGKGSEFVVTLPQEQNICSEV